MNISVHNRFLIRICVGALIVSLGACQIGDLGDPIVVPDVEREFHIDLWENLYPESRELVFQIETVEEQECQNATISYNLIRTGNSVKLSLNDITKPVDCQPGPVRIMANAPAGRLNGGLYTMKLDLKNTVFNEGQLTVTNEMYSLDMNTDYGFTFRHKRLLRVPQQTYWGYLVCETPDQESIASAFLSELEDASIKENFTVGYYGHFTVNTDSSVEVREVPANGAVVKSFLLKYEDTGSGIRQQINAFRAAHGTALPLKVFNAKGETW